MRKSKFLLVVLMVVNVQFCRAKCNNEASAYPMHFLNRQLTLILINDNFSPPVASRVYAYTSIAAYTTLTESAGKENGLRKGLIEFPKFPVADVPASDYSPSLTSAYTFFYVSKKLIYTFEPFQDSFKVLLNWYKNEGCTEAEIANAQKVARGYADLFIAWMSKDRFAETRRMPEYVLDDQPGHWTPTYPGYMPGLEPHWGLIRKLIAGSDNIDLGKFEPLPYDTSARSSLYKEAINVNGVATNGDKEQLGIADFWDCNAFAIFPAGHTDNIIKKMSPGGHWMNIAGIAAAANNADIFKSCLAYALTAAALFDGFIHTWKLKYKYKTLRPETYLQNNGFPEFRPYLQSPPFPEFPSGHAVISMAAATVLTHVYGPSFQFTDNTEDTWKIPARKFTSFKQAAYEAGISRYYGSIHYKYSCDEGSKIGAVIGSKLLEGITK